MGTKPKTYKERDHTVSKNAKERRAAVRAQRHGKPSNVGNPNEKGATGKK